MMSEKYILTADKRVVRADLLTWARWFESAERRVAKTKVGDVTISTVFVGIDYGNGRGEPIVWETMTFPSGSLNEQDEDRCSGTWEQAEAMHERMVEKVRACV